MKEKGVNVPFGLPAKSVEEVRMRRCPHTRPHPRVPVVDPTRLVK